MKCPNCKKSFNMEEVLCETQKEFAEAVKSLVLDERDNYPDFEGIVKEHLGFIPTKKCHKELYQEYRDLKKTADEAVDVASDLAMAYRKEGRVTIAKLEDKFENLKNSL